MLCHKIVHIACQRKRKYVVSMILQISIQSRAWQLVLCDWVNLTTEYEGIMKYIDASNFTCYLKVQ